MSEPAVNDTMMTTAAQKKKKSSGRRRTRIPVTALTIKATRIGIDITSRFCPLIALITNSLSFVTFVRMYRAKQQVSNTHVHMIITLRTIMLISSVHAKLANKLMWIEKMLSTCIRWLVHQVLYATGTKRQQISHTELFSHTRTVVRECCKGDDASQWENGKFDPLPRPNPLTDRHKKLHT